MEYVIGMDQSGGLWYWVLRRDGNPSRILSYGSTKDPKDALEDSVRMIKAHQGALENTTVVGYPKSSPTPFMAIMPSAEDTAIVIKAFAEWRDAREKPGGDPTREEVATSVRSYKMGRAHERSGFVDDLRRVLRYNSGALDVLVQIEELVLKYAKDI